MGVSLKNQAEKAQLRRQISQDRLVAKQNEEYLFFLNKNIATSRDRARTTSYPSSPERDLNTTDRKKSIDIARQQIEENPLVAGMIQTDIDNIIGHGYRLSMRTKDSGFNKEVEDLWNLEKDKLDVRGVRTFGDLQRMWDFRKCVDGDIGIHLMPDAEKYEGRVMSWVQSVEAERIYKEFGQAYDSGVDFDNNGRPKIYHVGPRQKETDPKSKVAKPTPIEADRFILYMNQFGERAERERGGSQIIPIFNYVSDIEAILDAMLLKVKKEAFLGMKFKTESNPNGNLFGTGAQTSKKAEDGVTRKHVKMVHGLNLNLSPNEDAEVMESKSPNSEFIPFIRLMIRLTGLPLGMPLEMILMDPSETNYSGLRSLLEFAKKRFRVAQKHASCVSSKVFQWWLSRQVKHNGLKVPDSIAATYWAHRWGMPGWPYLDPVKEITAMGMALDRGLTTLDALLAETSDLDVEDIVEQRKYEINLFKENGIPIASEIAAVTITDQDGSSVSVGGGGKENENPPTSDFEQLRQAADAYGTCVRAGVITPQPDDEKMFREKLGLPAPSKDVSKAWSEDGGVRRPITLKYDEETPPAPVNPAEDEE